MNDVNTMQRALASLKPDEADSLIAESAAHERDIERAIDGVLSAIPARRRFGLRRALRVALVRAYIAYLVNLKDDL